jgi:hypothetical protein
MTDVRALLGSGRWAGLVAAVLLGSCGGGGGGGGPRFPLTPGSVDLFADGDAAADTVQVITRFFPPDHCAVVEGATQPGTRRLLRFDTVIANLGDTDLVIGDPAAPEPPLQPDDFEYSPCHDHYHFTGFAEYELRDSTGAVVGLGHKQAFCLVDSLRYASGSTTGAFDCDFQGISSGWADLYDRTLDGQWVDVTGVAPGNYTLVITVDAADEFPEGLDLYANVAMVPVTIPP